MREIVDQCIRLLTELRDQIDGKEPEFPAAAKELVERGICLNCKKALAGEKPIRGCHPRCHRRIERRIGAGELTERQAIARGFLAPKAPAGRKRLSNDELGKFLAAQEEQEPDITAEGVAEVIAKSVKKSRAKPEDQTSQKKRKTN